MEKTSLKEKFYDRVSEITSLSKEQVQRACEQYERDNKSDTPIEEEFFNHGCATTIIKYVLGFYNRQVSCVYCSFYKEFLFKKMFLHKMCSLDKNEDADHECFKIFS